MVHERKSSLGSRGPRGRIAHPVSLPELTKAFGTGGAFKATISATASIAAKRGISTEAAAKILRSTASQIRLGQKRLDKIVGQRGHPVTQAVAMQQITVPRVRGGLQKGQELGKRIEPAIVSFIIKRASPSLIELTPRNVLRLNRKR